jgi:hypothetical protein
LILRCQNTVHFESKLFFASDNAFDPADLRIVDFKPESLKDRPAVFLHDRLRVRPAFQGIDQTASEQRLSRACQNPAPTASSTPFSVDFTFEAKNRLEALCISSA